MNAKQTAGTAWQEDAGYSRRTIVWVAVVTSASFVVALVLMAFGPDLAQQPTAGASTFSYSALGHRALMEMLEESGYSVRVRRTRRFSPARSSAPVIVAEPEVDRDRDYVRELVRRSAARRRPLILVLPKWSGTSYRTEGGLWAQEVSLVERAEIQEILDDVSDLRFHRVPSGQTRRVVRRESSWGDTLDIELIEPQLLSPSPESEAIVWGDDGVLVARVEAPRTGRPVYIVSDPDVLNNHGLARRDNAIVIPRLLSRVLGADAVVFDEVVHGHDQERSFLAETLRFPLVLSVFHGVLVLALVLWAGMRRFGKPHIAPPRLVPGTRGLIDSTSKLLSYKGRALDSAIRYFDETLLGVARHYHMPRELSRDKLLERIGELSRKRGLEMDLVATRTGLLRTERSGTKVDERSVETALALHRWRQEMTDGHGRESDS